MPQLNPEVDISAIQLVQPETSREELLDIYLEVYKLHRLPGSPPGEPAILEEVSAALPCPSMEEEDTPDAPKQQSRLPRCKRDSSLDRNLARVCKVHRKALSAAATLEEEIERLYRMRACSSTERRRRGRDSQESGKRRKKRQCQVSFSSQPATSQSASPDTLHGRMGSKGEDSDLGEPPQLKAEVASFLQ